MNLGARLPFRLLSIDSDNGSEFISWQVGRWCARRAIDRKLKEIYALADCRLSPNRPDFGYI
jgi:transposase InsO family protein